MVRRFAVLFASLVLFPAGVSAQDIGLAPLVEAVKQAILLLDEDFDGDTVFAIDDVEYVFASARTEVQLTTKVDGSGKISFSVITLDAGAETAATQTVTVDLFPPRAGDRVDESGAVDTAEQLVDLLLMTIEELEEGLLSDPELLAGKIAVTTRFGVEKSGGAGFKFKLFGFGAEGGGGLTDARAQKVTLVFEPVADG